MSLKSDCREGGSWVAERSIRDLRSKGGFGKLILEGAEAGEIKMAFARCCLLLSSWDDGVPS